nr:universal stress protein [uncultured Devosia sp.]
MLSDVFVPLLTYPDPTPVEFAKTLPDFIGRFASSVTFCPTEIDVPDLANRWGAALISLPQMIAEVEARSRRLAQHLKQETSGVGGPLAVHQQMVRAAFGQVGSALLPHARSHDLSLVAIDAGSDEKTGLAETFIFGTGRPVMVVPEQHLASADLGNIAIAWDGERCANRAVFDAMPLLVGARKVTLLTASDDKPVGDNDLKALVAYLNRHGIQAEHREISAKAANGIGNALQDGAHEIGAGLLVMGAYGHNRLREFVLGGATRSVLAAPRLPILLSH